MDAIWAMRSLGIDPATGQEIFLAKDKDGKDYRTFYYSANQQVVCGDRLPKFRGNFSINTNYRGFGLSAVLNYQWGASMYNSTLVDKVENVNMNYNVDRRVYTDRWREEGQLSKYKKIQKVLVSNRDALLSTTTEPTSRFVQKRNELQISSLQLSYDFYRYDFVKKLGLERLVVKFNTNNLYTFSTIKVERGTAYPFARTFSGSINVVF